MKIRRLSGMIVLVSVALIGGCQSEESARTSLSPREVVSPRAFGSSADRSERIRFGAGDRLGRRVNLAIRE